MRETRCEEKGGKKSVRKKMVKKKKTASLSEREREIGGRESHRTAIEAIKGASIASVVMV